jgi:hypothetical protein
MNISMAFAFLLMYFMSELLISQNTKKCLPHKKNLLNDFSYFIFFNFLVFFYYKLGFIFFSLFCFVLAVLGFELRAPCLLGSTVLLEPLYQPLF